jgi:transposase InsO family protein
VEQQREEFVRLARQPDANVSQLCRRFAISRKTGYKWLARDDLRDRSRCPHSSPGRTPPAVEAQVIALRAQHPAWGGRKIAHVLARDAGVTIASTTVNWVLKRHGLISAAASEAATPWHRFEHAAPNSLWQVDFKGHFATDTVRCHPLTVLDDHSRFNIVLHALGNERLESVQPVLQHAFERYGLPQRINGDNGPPWGTSGEGTLTTLGVWLIRLGVQLSHSRPAHPQTNGKDERFHRTMQAELLSTRHFKDLADAQHHFSDWRHRYNFKRPHHALGMDTPASRYTASTRSMPGVLPPVEYGVHDIVRRVTDGGRIRYKGTDHRVGRALIGQPVALRPRADLDGALEVYFCHQRVGTIDLNQAD